MRPLEQFISAHHVRPDLELEPFVFESGRWPLARAATRTVGKLHW
jgi:hypothetical protein